MKKVQRIILTTASVFLGMGLAVSASAGCRDHHSDDYCHQLHHDIKHKQHKQQEQMADGERRAAKALYNGHPNKARDIMHDTMHQERKLQHQIEHKKDEMHDHY